MPFKCNSHVYCIFLRRGSCCVVSSTDDAQIYTDPWTDKKDGLECWGVLSDGCWKQRPVKAFSSYNEAEAIWLSVLLLGACSDVWSRLEGFLHNHWHLWQHNLLCHHLHHVQFGAWRLKCCMIHNKADKQ